MTESRFAIRQQKDPSAGITRLHLIGRFDRSARGALHRAVNGALVRGRTRTVVVDLGAVLFLGSECVHVLLTGYTRALVAGYGYEVAGARGHVRQVLATVRLSPSVDVDELLAGPVAVEDEWWLDASMA